MMLVMVVMMVAVMAPAGLADQHRPEERQEDNQRQGPEDGVKFTPRLYPPTRGAGEDVVDRPLGEQNQYWIHVKIQSIGPSGSSSASAPAEMFRRCIR